MRFFPVFIVGTVLLGMTAPILSPSVGAQVLINPGELQAEPAPTLIPNDLNALDLRADEQTFDQRQQVFTATGNVTMRFRRSRLQANQVRIDLKTKQLQATGGVYLSVGEQKIRGESLDYDFGRETGVFTQVQGEIRFANLENDITPLSRSTDPPPSPFAPVTETGLRLLRFRADQVRFDARTWEGDNVVVTNDPVEPPEVAIQAPGLKVTLDERGSGLVTVSEGKLVFDQVTFLPIPVRFRIDQFRRGLPITLRTDAGEPGRGLLLQANLDLFDEPDLSFILSPQLFLGPLLGNSANRNGLAGVIGLETQLRLRGAGGQLLSILTQLDGLILNELGSRFRAQIVYSIPTGDGGAISPFYSYRQLFYNGLLGFQTVDNRLGVTYGSPRYTLGDPDFRFNYQATAEYIDALGETVISTNPDQAKQNARLLQLSKFSLEAVLDRRFPLWLAPLADVPQSALRYSRDPVQQGLWLITGVSGSQFIYGNGSSQSYLVAKVGLQAVIGQLLADSFDYTGLNITYSNGLLSGTSPFLFDRIVTREQLELGILQQIYGPVQVGAETTLDLQTGRSVDTTYTLGFNRRTYGVTLRFSPIRQSGALQLRIDGFNWTN